MSRRRNRNRGARHPGTQNSHDHLAALVAQARIPGGCDDCDAYQTVDASLAPGIRILVHHDDTCPWWTARRRGRVS